MLSSSRSSPAPCETWNSLSYSKQLPLHSTENLLNVVWYGPDGRSCTVTKLYSCLPRRVYPCWPFIRCTTHDPRHLTYDINRNVSESVQSVGSNLAFRQFEVLQHLKRTHIICVCCFKSVWLFLLLRQKVKDEVPKACISRCRNFGTVTGFRFADFSQFLIKKNRPLHGNLKVTDILCILPGSKLINTWVCDTPETLQYLTSPENHSSSVRVVFVQKNRWFTPFDANNEEILNILIEGLERDRIAVDPTYAAGLTFDIQRNFIATVGRYMHVQLSSYSTNKN